MTPLSQEESTARANAARERLKARGLGDTVARALESTGIAMAAKAVLGDGCGCKRRQAWLNAMVPYSPKESEPSTDTGDRHESQSDIASGTP